MAPATSIFREGQPLTAYEAKQLLKVGYIKHHNGGLIASSQ
jgi:hypothetical protein